MSDQELFLTNLYYNAAKLESMAAEEHKKELRCLHQLRKIPTGCPGTPLTKTLARQMLQHRRASESATKQASKLHVVASRMQLANLSQQVAGDLRTLSSSMFRSINSGDRDTFERDMARLEETLRRTDEFSDTLAGDEEEDADDRSVSTVLEIISAEHHLKLQSQLPNVPQSDVIVYVPTPTAPSTEPSARQV
jgi:phage terminase Nu1 subunit (DNA packaging protein)